MTVVTLRINDVDYPEDCPPDKYALRISILECIHRQEQSEGTPVETIEIDDQPLPSDIVEILRTAAASALNPEYSDKVDEALAGSVRRMQAISFLSSVLEEFRDITSRTPELSEQDQQTLNEIIWKFDDLEILRGHIDPSSVPAR